MDIIYEGMELLANGIDAAGVCVFLTLLLGVRTMRIRKGFFYGCTAAFVVLLSVLPYGTDNSVVQILVILALEIGYAACFLKGSLGVKAVYAAVYEMILMLVDFTEVYGLSWLLDVDLRLLMYAGNPVRMMALILNKTVMIGVVAVVIVLLGKIEFVLREWIPAILMYIGILLTGSVMVNITKSGHLSRWEETQMVIVAVGLLAIGIAISICIYQLNLQRNIEMQNRLLSTQLQEQRENIESMTRSGKNIQILQHDLKRYLSTTLGMLHQGEQEQATDYLESVLNRQFAADHFYKTSSSVINAVLNEKAGICAQKQIPYQVTVVGRIPKEGQIEMGMMLSNLIDNAIAAQEQVHDPHILVSLLPYRAYYVLRVENRVDVPTGISYPQFFQKTERSGRQMIGMRSVKKMVDDMQGYYLWKERDHKFIATVMLPDRHPKE